MAEGLLIRFGKVTGLNDPYGGGRIQVRTVYDNITKKNEDLAYCAPLLPNMLHIRPKVGELVLVISMGAGQFDQPNFYIGPIISQPDKLFYEEYDSAIKVTDTGYWDWHKNPKLEKGVQPTLYPAIDDISIEGRKDAEIQLKNEEVRIKAGVKVVNFDKPKNNTDTPSFISLKYYPKNDYDRDGFKSTATIVADKINLIGTHTDDPDTENIPVTENKDMTADERDNLISDSAMKELINKAHQLPYGDKLIEFLDLLRTAMATHVHPFPTMPPCNDPNMVSVMTYNLDKTLSDNVRIN